MREHINSYNYLCEHAIDINNLDIVDIENTLFDTINLGDVSQFWLYFYYIRSKYCYWKSWEIVLINEIYYNRKDRVFLPILIINNNIYYPVIIYTNDNKYIIKSRRVIMDNIITVLNKHDLLSKIIDLCIKNMI